MDIQFRNEYELELKDAKSGKIKKRVFSHNTVCIPGLMNFINITHTSTSTYNLIGKLGVGSGSGTPTENDTALFASLGTWASTVVERAITSKLTGYVKVKKEFSTTDLVGKTITEIGLFDSAYSGLVAHSMLKDAEGNAISILKTDTDILTIYATVYVSIAFTPQENFSLVEQSYLLALLTNGGGYKSNVGIRFDYNGSGTFIRPTIDKTIGSLVVTKDGRKLTITSPESRVDQTIDLYFNPRYIHVSNTFTKKLAVTSKIVGELLNSYLTTKYEIKSIDNVYLNGVAIDSSRYSYSSLISGGCGELISREKYFFLYDRNNKLITMYNDVTLKFEVYRIEDNKDFTLLYDITHANLGLTAIQASLRYQQNTHVQTPIQDGCFLLVDAGNLKLYRIYITAEAITKEECTDFNGIITSSSMIFANDSGTVLYITSGNTLHLYSINDDKTFTFLQTFSSISVLSTLFIDNELHMLCQDPSIAASSSYENRVDKIVLNNGVYELQNLAHTMTDSAKVLSNIFYRNGALWGCTTTGSGDGASFFTVDDTKKVVYKFSFNYYNSPYNMNDSGYCILSTDQDLMFHTGYGYTYGTTWPNDFADVTNKSQFVMTYSLNNNGYSEHSKKYVVPKIFDEFIFANTVIIPYRKSKLTITDLLPTDVVTIDYTIDGITKTTGNVIDLSASYEIEI